MILVCRTCGYEDDTEDFRQHLIMHGLTKAPQIQLPPEDRKHEVPKCPDCENSVLVPKVGVL